MSVFPDVSTVTSWGWKRNVYFFIDSELQFAEGINGSFLRVTTVGFPKEVILW